jgi:predicted esterase
MNPGFIGLENWAEQNDVILVAINSVTNEMYSLNWQAQDAALSLVVESMRVDRSMGFAIGMSGGAATSWEMVARYPEGFAGLVMMGISDGHNGSSIPIHVRVAYIYGNAEPNINHIKRKIPRLRAAGNKVREQVVPGGHVTGPVKVREAMLTWMLNDVKAVRTP